MHECSISLETFEAFVFRVLFFIYPILTELLFTNILFVICFYLFNLFGDAIVYVWWDTHSDTIYATCALHYGPWVIVLLFHNLC